MDENWKFIYVHFTVYTCQNLSSSSHVETCRVLLSTCFFFLFFTSHHEIAYRVAYSLIKASDGRRNVVKCANLLSISTSIMLAY